MGVRLAWNSLRRKIPALEWGFYPCGRATYLPECRAGDAFVFSCPRTALATRAQRCTSKCNGVHRRGIRLRIDYMSSRTESSHTNHPSSDIGGVSAPNPEAKSLREQSRRDPSAQRKSGYRRRPARILQRRTCSRRCPSHNLSCNADERHQVWRG